MKTVKLYETDAYKSRFEATVLQCEKSERGYKSVLSETAFFPEGGGQPCDIGLVSDTKVFDVQIENGEIFHFTKTPLNIGEKVTCIIDFPRRFCFMQNHTAEHIVSGLVFSKFGFDNIGFHLNENEVSFDFNGFFTEEQLSELELEANRRVWQNLKVTAFYPTAEELKNTSYRSKSGIEGEIRLVKIDGTDICACCAPHVKNTGEIGLIKLLGTEKQHGGTRIFMKCGGFALSDYNGKSSDIKAICEALSSKPEEAAEAVLSLCKRLDNEKQISKDLKSQLFECKIKFFDNSNRAMLCEHADVRDLQMLADGLHKTYGGVRTALAPNLSGAAFVMCGEDREVEAEFGKLKASFEIKGGGRGGIRQGSIVAPIAKIKEFFCI